MNSDARIYVAGHRGMVGSAIVRALERAGYPAPIVATSAELDLRDRAATGAFLSEHRPSHVFLAAGTVGGILANQTRPAEFLYDNLLIAANVIDEAYRVGVDKLLYLGSSCIYPKLAPQPIAESALLGGPLEPSNEAYAVAKIAGIKLCQAYRSQYGCNFIAAMPTNLYGPNDNFDLESAHVLAALIRRFHEAKTGRSEIVTLWGSGAPRREFCHVDDVAEACLFLMQAYDAAEIVNVGYGKDISIAELARLVARIVGFDGEIAFDRSKPDGTPRKLTDTARLTALGWRARIPLEQGIAATYRWFSERLTSGELRL